MKKIIITSAVLLTAVFFLLMACTKTEWKEIENIKPGFSVFYDSSTYTVVLTKDMYADTVDYTTLDINLQYYFNLQMEEYAGAGILKSLQDENGTNIETVAQVKVNELSDTLKVIINSKAQLFEGISFPPDSIRFGYSFVFRPYVISSSQDTVFTAYGDYAVIPEYVNFCDIPEFPLGVYEAHNKATGFKKDIEIRYIEVIPDVWFYVITDFGLDWSTWDDFWYGTNFSLACPKQGDTRFVVEFAAWGIDLSTIIIEMENDEGVMESRPLRVMPWTYDAETPDIGYYDDANKQFIFKNVQVKDTWWNIDNHFLEEITFTYKGK